VSPDEDPTRIICQRPYELAEGPEFYRQYVTRGDTSGVTAETRVGGAPSGTILPLTDAQINEVTATPPSRLPDARTYRAHGIETVLPANTVMVPADYFLGQIILSGLGDRPIYFAMTTQAYEELNLRPYLIRQGVALKLNDGPVMPDSTRGVYEVPPSGLTSIIGPYIDVPRTERLLSDVFVHRGGIPEEWGHWVDVATEGIPAYYGYSHLGMALVYESHGRSEDAQRHYVRGNQWLDLANRRFATASDP
jgi:hypothetical protein